LGFCSGRQMCSPLPRPDRQAVAVVHGGAIVLDRRRIGDVEQEHAAHRRHAGLGHGGAREDAGGDVERHVVARPDREAVGARAAGAVHQGVDHHRVAALGPFQPEGGEVGELLVRLARPDRQAARRQAVALAAAQAAEVAGALEHGDLVQLAGLVQRPQQAKAGKAVPALGDVGVLAGDVEHRRIEGDRPRQAGGDLVDRQRARIQPGRRKELGPERRLAVLPQIGLGAEADAEIVVVGQARDGRRRGRLGVGRGRQGAGLVAQPLDRERLAGVVDGGRRGGGRLGGGQARRQGQDADSESRPSAARRLSGTENIRAF
jgi:hypothetical protein